MTNAKTKVSEYEAALEAEWLVYRAALESFDPNFDYKESELKMDCLKYDRDEWRVEAEYEAQWAKHKKQAK